MRTILPIFLTGIALAAAGETISGVSVVQQWPWSEAVSVDFSVSGWNEAELAVKQVELVAYDGDTAIGPVAPAALSGDMIIDGDGAKHIVLMPSKDPKLRVRGRVSRFKVTLATASVPPEDVLYIVLDPAKAADARGARQYVTRQALTNGVWGAWEKTSSGGVIWTGLAAEEKYFREFMAFRRVPAGSFTMGHGADNTGKR